MTLPQLNWLLLIVTALGPPALAWYWARTLRRHRQEALLAEQFWAFRTRLSRLFVFGAIMFGLNLSMIGWRGYVAAVVGTVTTLAVVHSVRREILDETWSFGRYLWFRLRAAVAFGGFWIALVGAPYLVGWSGSWAWLVAPALVVGLLVWLRWSAALQIWLLAALPVTDPSILEGLRRIVDRTQLAAPRLFRAGPPGSVTYNAFAMPSLGGHRVLFFSTLLERLSTAETLAILAHEVAHLEQFNRRVLRRQFAIITVLVVIGTTLVPWGRSEFSSLVIDLVWTAIVLAGVADMGRGSRARESDSDRRALELTGDADTLIAALRSVHSIGLIPRRLDADLEARSTHPTLARRIDAIRKLAGQPATPGVEAALVIPATQEGAYLLFEADEIRYLRGVVAPIDHATAEDLAKAARSIDVFPFSRIGSVHLEPRNETVVVSIRPVEGELARVAVPGRHIAAIQSVLDRIDHRFGPPLKGIELRTTMRTVAVSLLLIAAMTSQLALAAQALVTSVSPTRRAAAALGAASAAAGLLLAAGRPAPEEQTLILLWALAVVFCVVAVARWRRTAMSEASRRIEAIALGSLALVSVALITSTGTDPLDLSTAAASLPAAVIAPTSFGAWLLMSRPARLISQLGALCLFCVAGGVALMGTTWFVDRFSRDPLLTTKDGLAGSHGFQRTVAELTPARTLPAGNGGDLRVSPDGEAAAVLEWCEDQDRCRSRHTVVATVDGRRREFEAIDVRFVDASRLVVAVDTTAGMVLRLERLDGTLDSWSVQVNGVMPEMLGVNIETRQWVVLGTMLTFPEVEPSGEQVRVSGSIGISETSLRPMGQYDDTERAIEWVSNEKDAPLGIETNYDEPVIQIPWQLRMWLDLPMTDYRSRSALFRWKEGRLLQLVDSRLEIRCASPGAGGRDIVCMAEDGTRTHLWRVAPSSAVIEPLGWTEGSRWFRWPPVQSRWLATDNRCQWQIVDVVARRDQQLVLEDRCPAAVDINGSVVGVLAPTGDDQFAVRTYRLQSIER